MIAVIGPQSGGVGHVSEQVARQWQDEGMAVELLLVSEAGWVSSTGCDCRVPTASAGSAASAGAAGAAGSAGGARSSWVPVAFRSARQAWLHRRCLRRADSIHLELGRTAVGAFWFGLVALLLVPAARAVTVLHDVPLVVLHPSAALFPQAPGWRDAVAHKVIARLLDRPVLDLLRRRAAVSVVLSTEAAADARRLNWPAVRQVSLGAEPKSAGAIRPGAANYVLVAGFLGPGKGLDVVAEAWGAIDWTALETDIRLVVAGGHSAQHASWIADVRAVLDRGPRPPTWRGYVSDDEFAELIKDAAVVIIPYVTSNPASEVLVRALVEGRAVIATRVAAVVDEVSDGVNGILVRPGDATQLGAALMKLMSSPELRDQLGSSAAQRGAAVHSWAQHVATLTELHLALSAGSASDAAVAGRAA
ncbi:MAG: glycosyl transferase group 1 [Frankiales bacterium]|nr:glycosyl transferase group 1 [Frankiales bacterium]